MGLISNFPVSPWIACTAETPSQRRGVQACSLPGGYRGVAATQLYGSCTGLYGELYGGCTLIILALVVRVRCAMPVSRVGHKLCCGSCCTRRGAAWRL